MVFKDGQKVVFIGNSITDCGRRDEHAPFGNGYVSMVIDLITARYPERRIRYINQGIGGDTVLELENRWTADVIELQPDWVSVKIGINDLHRTLGGQANLPPARFEKTYGEILGRVRKETPASLVLIDPFYISIESNPGTHEGRVLELLPGYLEAVARLAKKFDARHVLTHDRFRKQLKHRSPSHFSPEPVHPNATGHMVIAEAVLEALEW